LGLLSLFVFGVTLEALNDPKELSAIPFNPWDFLTYGLIALGILLLICILRKPDPRKTLTRKRTSDVKNERGRIRTALRLNHDGNAEIDSGYRYLYDDFRDEGANDFLYQMSLYGLQGSIALKA
jgi:hypothetical protein